MISIPNKVFSDAINFNRKRITSRVKTLKMKLAFMLFHEVTTDVWMINYILLMLNNIDTLVKGNHEELEKLKEKFDAIILPNEVADAIAFKNELIKKMGYSYLRKTFYPVFFNQLGIKSCVYCNAHITIAVEKKNGDLLAKYQLDHYWPKSSYPCFSISLYNLYPTCASCNHIKNDDFVRFNLHSNLDEYVNSEFSFELEDSCWIKYLEKFDRNEIKIRFSEPDLPIINPMGLKSIDEVFAITQIYQTQTEIVEELILKSQKYTEVYKQDLIKIYPELFNTSSLANRVLISNYSDIQDIHRRPMAKFTQDIARQLGLIT